MTAEATTTAWTEAVVGMGGNLGDRLAGLRFGAEQLQAHPGRRRFTFSRLYETEAVDCPEPYPFLNAAVRFETRESPDELLRALLAIEDQLHRSRPYVNAPRPLDLDLLLFGELVLQTPRLTLPHPRLHLRLFVLRPMLDCISGERRHPALGQSFDALHQGQAQGDQARGIRLYRGAEWTTDQNG